MNENLGDIIKNAREKMGISQRELAKRIDVNNTEISRIEKNIRKKPNIYILIRLSNELNLNLKKLLKITGYNENTTGFLGVKGSEKMEQYCSYYQEKKIIDIIKILQGYKNNELNEDEVIGLLSIAIGMPNLNQFILPEQRKKYKLDSIVAKAEKKS